MNNVTSNLAPSASDPVILQTDLPPDTVTIGQITDLLIELAKTTSKSVLSVIADSISNVNDRLNAIGDLQKRITVLKQGLKDDKDHVDLNDPKKLQQIKDIVAQMQELVSSQVEMPTGNKVTQGYLDGWSQSIQTEQQRLGTQSNALAARTSTATQNQSVFYENATGLTKTMKDMGLTIAQALK